MFNYSTLPKDNNHYYQYLKGNRNNGLHINTQSLGIHFNDQQQQQQQQDQRQEQSITSPSLLATCEPPLSPTTDDGSPSSSTSSTTTSPIFKNSILPCPPLSHSLPQFVTRRKSTITRKSSPSSSTSPQVTCQSWDHLKSPAAMFLAGFASPTTTTITETESTSTSLPSYCEEQEGDEIDDYVINEIIGYGGFSTVRKGYCISDGQTVALKIIKKKNNNIEQDLDLRLEHELQIWQKMNHPYIVKIQKVLETDYANYIICDYCSNGTLLEKLQQKGLLKDQDKKRIFSQLVQAVHYLHQQCQVIHKDIKLDNVLLDDDMNVKLCDFGLAVHRQFTTSTPTHLSHLAHGDNNNDLIPSSSPLPPNSPSASPNSSSTTSCHSGVGGSLAYCAPEQLKSSQILSCPKTDIWSLGIVLYAMFAGKLPFDDDYDVRLRQSILDGDYSMPSDFHPDLADLISHCLDPNPIHRFSLDQIMNHPWFSS